MSETCDTVRELGRQMLEDPNWVCRAKAAERLGKVFCSGGLSGVERAAAEEFFRITRFDGEIHVRRVLTESLKRASALSRDTLLLFVEDRPEVAAPLIEHSPLFGEPDLLRIIDTQSGGHRLAVARRFCVTEPICEPLLASGDERVITALLRNRGAAIREEALWRLLAKPPIRPSVVHALVRRRALLPPRVLAKLIEICAALSLTGGRGTRCPILGQAAFAGVVPPAWPRAFGKPAKPARLLA